MRYPLFASLMACVSQASLRTMCTPSSPKILDNGLAKETGWATFRHGVAAMLGTKGSIEPDPSQDAFYGITTKPDDLRALAPGTILRSRGIYFSDFPGFDAEDQMGWQIAYVSRGQTNDDPIVTVLTIIVPPNAGDRSKILFQAPKTDSAAPGCRTSYMLRRGNGSLVGAASEQLFTYDYLKRGYVTVVVDYEGQYDAFGAGPTSGHALLDSIRAVLAFKDLKLPADQSSIKIVGWGYSGGAIAISWAAQQLTTYAPELAPMIKGWSMGGVPIDMHKVALHVNNGIAAGLIVGVTQGLSNINPDLATWAQATFNDKGKALLEIARTKCFFSFMTKCAEQNVLNLKPDGSNDTSDETLFLVQGDPFAQEAPQRVMEENRLTAEFERTGDKSLIPQPPVFVIESIPDEVVPIRLVDDLMLLWTTNGATIEYTRVKGWLHVGALFALQDKNVEWIADRMDGKPLKQAPGTLLQNDRDNADIDDQSSKDILGSERSKALKAAFLTTYKNPFASTWW